MPLALSLTTAQLDLLRTIAATPHSLRARYLQRVEAKLAKVRKFKALIEAPLFSPAPMVLSQDWTCSSRRSRCPVRSGKGSAIATSFSASQPKL